MTEKIYMQVFIREDYLSFKMCKLYFFNNNLLYLIMLKILYCVIL